MSRVDADGCAIEYQVTGQRLPVILLHGFPIPVGSGGIRTGAGRGRIPGHRPCLRGYGSSGKPQPAEA